MAQIPAITIPNADVPDALAGLEDTWKNDAERIFGATQYAAMTAPQKLRACLAAELRVRTRNYRRTQAERAVVTPPEPDVV